MSSHEPIRGKVARILTSRQLAMNIGKADGVAVGMEFNVLDPKGEAIEDPDSREVLGSLNRTKVRVKVVQVEDRISVAETFKSRRVNVGGVGPSLGLGMTGLARLLMPPVWVDRDVTLKTTEKTWEDLDESESFVKTGDPVVQILEVKVEDTKLIGDETSAPAN